MSTVSKSIQAEDVKVLQTMIDTMVGTPKFSYPARQNNSVKPSGEFAHIRLIEEYPVNIPHNKLHAQDELTTTYRTYGVARLRFRVGVVDTDGIAASKIMHGWTSEGIKALMISSGYGFIRCEPLADESAKLEKEWEIRQGFSVDMYATRVYEEVVDNITQLNISGELVCVTDTYISEFEINIL